jgi:Spy/CpxP family protein refolding chaperone
MLFKTSVLNRQVFLQRLIPLCALLCLSANSLDGAQPRNGPREWWKSEEIRQELELSDEAVASIDAIFQATMPDLRAAYRLLRKHQEQFDQLLEQVAVSEEEVLHEVDHLEAARAEANKARAMMLFKMRRVFTPDQRNKLDKIRERRQNERRTREPNDSQRRR